jgi:hypothetical protein
LGTSWNIWGFLMAKCSYVLFVVTNSDPFVPKYAIAIIWRGKSSFKLYIIGPCSIAIVQITGRIYCIWRFPEIVVP